MVLPESQDQFHPKARLDLIITLFSHAISATVLHNMHKHVACTQALMHGWPGFPHKQHATASRLVFPCKQLLASPH